MSADLSFGIPGNIGCSAQVVEWLLRCECGALVAADDEQSLVELTRLHFGEFHPDLGGNVPADLILAMAERKETSSNEPTH